MKSGKNAEEDTMEPGKMAAEPCGRAVEPCGEAAVTIVTMKRQSADLPDSFMTVLVTECSPAKPQRGLTLVLRSVEATKGRAASHSYG